MLKFLLDTLDGLDEATKAMYKKNDDGKYQLQVEGLPQQEDVSGLKNALQTERASVAKLEGDLRAWKKLGDTPDAVSTTIADLKKDKGDPTEQERLMEQLKTQHAEEVTKITGERDAALESERQAVINNGMVTALAKAGFSKTGLDMVPQIHGNRVKITERDGKRVVDIMTADGSAPMVGTGDGSRATFDDLAKELAVSYPDLVNSDRKGGAGTAPGGGGSGSEKQMLRSDWDKLDAMDQAKTISDGVQLVD